MLAFCSAPSEISLLLGPSDARWLSEEMSFLSELYRSKANSSEHQFGADDNAALASAQMPTALGRATTRRQPWPALGGQWPRSARRCFAGHRSAATSFSFTRFRNLLRLSQTSDPAKARPASGYAAHGEEEKLES
jgi:hypothetical protein